MGKEIERKFLVKNSSYKGKCSGILFRQGYLNSNPDRIVRVRISSNKGFITVKDKGTGLSRTEYEYEIPYKDAEEIIQNICEKPIIEKTRYIYTHMGFAWEIDEFFGDNQGLVIAEIELNSESEDFIKPDWIGEEVTHDYRYSNSNLISNPFKKWNT